MAGTCSIEGCGTNAVARGWCPKHWWRWRNYGDPNRGSVYDLTAEERFWRHVSRSSPDACWLWKASVRGDGYGAFRFNGRQMGAHRFSYQLEHGPLPAGMVVMHSCDVPLCVNPNHLSLGTQADNSADAARKGRRLPGSQNKNAKLTEPQVLELRSRYAAGGVTQAELAADYGISPALVSFIVTRRAWRHI